MRNERLGRRGAIDYRRTLRRRAGARGGERTGVASGVVEHGGGTEDGRSSRRAARRIWRSGGRSRLSIRHSRKKASRARGVFWSALEDGGLGGL